MHPNRLFILQHAKHEQQQQQQRSKSGYTTGDSRYHRHLIYMDWSMVCTVHVVVNVSYVSGHQKNMLRIMRWKQTRNKSKQADWLTRQAGRMTRQTGRLTRQAGWQGTHVCMLCFVPPTSTLVLLKWMFSKLLSVGQSNSLRYLWQAQYSTVILPPLVFLA